MKTISSGLPSLSVDGHMLVKGVSWMASIYYEFLLLTLGKNTELAVQTFSKNKVKITIIGQ